MGADGSWITELPYAVGNSLKLEVWANAQRDGR